MEINLYWLSCDELQVVPESEFAGVASKTTGGELPN
jgi:hypothetical protein